MELADRLRGTDNTTVARLAADLDVDVRTIRRDLAALRARGLPIHGEAGPGGGVRLEGDRGITAVHLTMGEVVTLWLTARLSQGTSDLPWGGAASSALAKLLGSLPRAKAWQLRSLCRRVIIGSPASWKVCSEAGAAPSELLRLFEEAFSSGIGLGFQYTDRDGKGSARRIEPHGLLVQTPVWYILARDADKSEPRMFRMDRVSHPRLLAGIRFVPDVTIIEAQLPRECGWQSLAGGSVR
jgi:predicted DNA-binding transcriptional regulator YafY